MNGTYQTPIGYAPDTLVNNELGWKTQWFGSRLQVNGAVYQEAQSPPFQGSIRARYEVNFNDYTAFVQVAASHQAHSYSATGNIVVFDQPSYTIYDASCGVSKGA